MTDHNSENVVKRTIKDSVFTDFFRMPENLLKLYKTLHPEDKTVSISDIYNITIENVLVDDLYNDLGFRIGNNLIILVEAQSTWTLNIIIRAFFYLAKSYKDYIDDNGLDIYQSRKVSIPKPEIYVIYTGDRKSHPEEISFKDEYFKGEDELAVDIKVKMLYGTDKEDVISQYVTFTKVYNEQRIIHGRSIKAIQETIKICKNTNILKEYLESREKEVINMYMTLFDEEQIMKNHDAHLTREVTRENQINSIRNLMETLKLSAEQAMDALKIPLSEQSTLLKNL